jgi:hypothetical protein
MPRFGRCQIPAGKIGLSPGRSPLLTEPDTPAGQCKPTTTVRLGPRGAEFLPGTVNRYQDRSSGNRHSTILAASELPSLASVSEGVTLAGCLPIVSREGVSRVSQVRRRCSCRLVISSQLRSRRGIATESNPAGSRTSRARAAVADQPAGRPQLRRGRAFPH